MAHVLALKLKNLILALLVPLIVLVAVGLGYLVYHDLRNQILNGFDNKLRAVSVATGSFIDGYEHDAIRVPHRVQGLAYDTGLAVLYGVDNETHELSLVDSTQGYTLPLGRVSHPLPSALTFARGDLYGLRTVDGTAELVKIDTGNSRVRRTMEIGFDCHGLAFQDGRFYCVAGGELVRVDPRSRRVDKVGPLGAPSDVTLLAGSGEPKTLFGYDPRRSQVFTIDTETGAAGSPTEPLPLPRKVQGLTFDPQTGLLFAASDRLTTVDPVTGEVVPVGLVDGFRSEQSPFYLKYVLPMRRIKEKADLTYLYTQVIHPGKRESCIYILDANEDEDHSTLGDEEGLPPDSAQGQWDVMTRAEVYLSDIEPSEAWGLLKTAYAPIFDPEGEVRGIAGADVSIAVIRSKTQTALAKAAGVGAVSLFLGVVIAVLISRRITHPVARLKDVALQLAAGDFERRAKLENLEEMRQLTAAFNEMGQALDEKITDLRKTNQALEIRRRLHEARTILLQNDALPIPERRVAVFTESLDDTGFASEAFAAGDEILLCLARRFPDKLTATRFHHTVSVLFRRLQEAETPPQKIVRELRDFFPRWIEAWARVVPAKAALHSWSRRPYTVHIFEADGKRQSLRLDGEADVVLSPGQALVVTDDREDDPLAKLGEAFRHSETDARRLLAALVRPHFLGQLTQYGESSFAHCGLHLVLVHPK